MIITIVTLTFGSEADVDAFCAGRKTQIEETRKEAGCIGYTFARDILEPRVIRVAEIWRDEAALKGHLETPHMRKSRATPLPGKPQSVVIKRYDGATEVPFTP